MYICSNREVEQELISETKEQRLYADIATEFREFQTSITKSDKVFENPKKSEKPMPNNTLEDYKEAIRIKFELEKNGVYSNYFNPPTQANLRDLCWKIFTSNPNSDDLKVYHDFFKTEFDPKTEDISTSYTDSFKKVRDFLKRKTEPAKIDTINLAAILVGFKLRPYQQFYLKSNAENQQSIKNDDSQIMILVNDKKNSDEKTEEKEKLQSQTLKSGNKFYVRLFKRSKKTLLITLFIFSLVATVVYCMFFEKNCMQWANDHYEVIYCDKPISGNWNEVIPKDDELLNFRKINVCDTTTCFRPDGEAIVWYSKRGEGVEFFNDHGRHPEIKTPLRPVTRYILNKYVYSKGIKCK